MYYIKRAYYDFRVLPVDERYLAAKLAVVAIGVTVVLVRCYYLTLSQ